MLKVFVQDEKWQSLFPPDRTPIEASFSQQNFSKAIPLLPAPETRMSRKECESKKLCNIHKIHSYFPAEPFLMLNQIFTFLLFQKFPNALWLLPMVTRAGQISETHPSLGYLSCTATTRPARETTKFASSWLMYQMLNREKNIQKYECGKNHQDSVLFPTQSNFTSDY